MKNQLNALAAALSLGLLWGIGLLVWTFIALQWGMGVSSLELVMDWYPAYEISTAGAFIGLVWGFLDGFVGTYIFVSLYNFLARKLSK